MFKELSRVVKNEKPNKPKKLSQRKFDDLSNSFRLSRVVPSQSSARQRLSGKCLSYFEKGNPLSLRVSAFMLVGSKSSNFPLVLPFFTTNSLCLSYPSPHENWERASVTFYFPPVNHMRMCRESFPKLKFNQLNQHKTDDSDRQKLFNGSLFTQLHLWQDRHWILKSSWVSFK